MTQLRPLLVQAACKTDDEATCGPCPHHEWRHSPVEPPRMSCELFRKWLGESGHKQPFNRLRDCIEAEQRAREKALADRPEQAPRGAPCPTCGCGFGRACAECGCHAH
jgi:hypothetical protein